MRFDDLRIKQKCPVCQRPIGHHCPARLAKCRRMYEKLMQGDRVIHPPPKQEEDGDG